MLAATTIASSYIDDTPSHAIENTLFHQLNDRMNLFDILSDSIISIQVNYYAKLLLQQEIHKQKMYLVQPNW